MRYLAAAHHDGPQTRVDRIVMHRTEGAPMHRGQAWETARYFAGGSGGRQASAHYVVDPGEIVQCVPETTVAYHAPPNANSIGVELSGQSATDDWATVDGGAMLGLAIGLVVDLCRRWNVPPVWLTPADLKAGRRGITSHNNVSQAWHQTTHTDPEPHFPHDSFVAAVARGLTKHPEVQAVSVAICQIKDGRTVVYREDGHAWVSSGPGAGATAGAGADIFSVTGDVAAGGPVTGVCSRQDGVVVLLDNGEMIARFADDPGDVKGDVAAWRTRATGICPAGGGVLVLLANGVVIARYADDPGDAI